MLIPEIETERLLLRMYKAGELESVYILITDKDVTRFFPDYYTVDKENVLKSLPRRVERWRKYGFGQLGVFDKTSDELIGYCGLQYLDNTEEVEIYYGLHKHFWGKGLAKEASKAMLRFGFEEAKLSRIVGVTHPENTASQKVLKSLGFVQGENGRFYDLEAAYFSLTHTNYQPNEATYYKLHYVEVECAG